MEEFAALPYGNQQNCECLIGLLQYLLSSHQDRNRLFGHKEVGVLPSWNNFHKSKSTMLAEKISKGVETVKLGFLSSVILLD